MSWIKYLLEANLYLVLFYTVYYLLLRRDTHYQLNRIYLLGSSLLAFGIPLVQLGFLKPTPVEYRQVITQANTISSAPLTHFTPDAVPAEPAIAINYYLLIYISIACIMAVAFGIRIYQLAKLARKGKHSAGNNFKLVEIEDEDHAFSFFSYLFIGKKLSASTTIIQHELVHIRQKHSIDIIYLELLKIICWFNPIVYLLQNSIKEVHEFIADNHIASAQQDINYYTDFLISNAYGLPETALTNNFFNKNLLKTRIIMLHQKRSGSLARLKLLITLPLLAGMLCLSTLGFTKDYSLIDLAPAKAKQVPPPPPVPVPNKPQVPPPPPKVDKVRFPPPRPLIAVTKKGYRYKQDGYLVNGKTDFRVIITEKDGEEKDFFRSKATPAITKLLKDKYGYTFPVMAIHDKMPPPPPVAAPDDDKAGKPAPPPPAPPKPKVDQIRFPPPAGKPGVPPPAPKVDQIRFPPQVVKPAPLKPKVDQIRFPPPVVRPDDTTGSGAFTELYSQLSKNIHYAADMRDNNIGGTVWVVFNIDNDRNIRNINIIRGVTPVQNMEIVNRLRNCFVPEAAKTGVNYTLPITFSLQSEDGKPVRTDVGYKGHSYTADYKPNNYPYKTLHEVVIVGYSK